MQRLVDWVQANPRLAVRGFAGIAVTGVVVGAVSMWIISGMDMAGAGLTDGKSQSRTNHKVAEDSPQIAQRHQRVDNSVYTVLLETQSQDFMGQGTGFFLRTGLDEVLFLTNRHVALAAGIVPPIGGALQKDVYLCKNPKRTQEGDTSFTPNPLLRINRAHLIGNPLDSPDVPQEPGQKLAALYASWEEQVPMDFFCLTISWETFENLANGLTDIIWVAKNDVAGNFSRIEPTIPKLISSPSWLTHKPDTDNGLREGAYSFTALQGTPILAVAGYPLIIPDSYTKDGLKNCTGLLLHKCPSVDGCSGSPLLNDDFQLIGLHHGSALSVRPGPTGSWNKGSIVLLNIAFSIVTILEEIRHKRDGTIRPFARGAYSPSRFFGIDISRKKILLWLLSNTVWTRFHFWLGPGLHSSLSSSERVEPWHG